MIDNSEYSPDEGYTAREKELLAQMLKDTRELDRALNAFKKADPEGYAVYWDKELENVALRVGRRWAQESLSTTREDHDGS